MTSFPRAFVVAGLAIGCGSGGGGGGSATPQPECDPAFGDQGIVLTEYGVSAEGRAVALQSDGRILVAGTRRITHAESPEVLVARYSADGALDPELGGSGIVTTDVGPEEDEGNAVVAGSDGTILVAGTHYYATSQSMPLLVRYTSSGALDTSFGQGGVVKVDACKPYGRFHALALQADGKIVAAGTCAHDLVVARFETGGALDTTFGTGGLVQEDLGPSPYFADVLLQPDGKIVAAGDAVRRFEPSGVPDATFAGSAAAKGFGSARKGLELTAAGALVVIGSEIGVGSDFFFSSFGADGSVSADFGTNGVSGVDVESSADTAWGMTLRPDGSLVGVGRADAVPSSAAESIWAVVRLTPGGAPDPSFGQSGAVLTRPTSDSSTARAAVALADGRVVAAGFADTGDVRQVALVRYLP